mgnify:CR=1 FL=1
MSIYEKWLAAKADETAAIERRRTIEDQLTAMLDLAPDAEGTTTAKRDGYVIKATCRLNRKVDGDKLQELAHDAGLTEHLASLFRWKPEISMKEWKSAATNITGPLSGAITTTAGRPSYTITKEESNNG